MINIYKLKLTSLQQEIVRLLFIKVGLSLNIRNIAKLLKVSSPAVKKALPRLEKEGFMHIQQDKASKRWSIELNRDKKKNIWLKRIDNLKQLYESGLIQEFYDTFPSGTIILFGSYSLGEDTISSDIDIAIIGAKQKEVSPEFEKTLERKININYYSSFKSMDKLFLENLLTGITLKGTIEI